MDTGPIYFGTGTLKKLHVSDPPMGWGTIKRKKQTKKKGKNKRKKEKYSNSSQHNSSLVHYTGTGLCNPTQSGEHPGSYQARVKLCPKITFFGFAINDNTMITSKFTQRQVYKCIKVKLAYDFMSFRILMSLYDTMNVLYVWWMEGWIDWWMGFLSCPEAVKHCSSGWNKSQELFPDAFWPTPALCSDISKNGTEQSSESLNLFVHQSSLSSVANVSGLHEKWDEMRMPVGESGQIKYVGLFSW